MKHPIERRDQRTHSAVPIIQYIEFNRNIVATDMGVEIMAATINKESFETIQVILTIFVSSIHPF